MASAKYPAVRRLIEGCTVVSDMLLAWMGRENPRRASWFRFPFIFEEVWSEMDADIPPITKAYLMSVALSRDVRPSTHSVALQ